MDDQAARDSSKTPRHRVHPRTLANARQLRAEIVNAELKLWQRLRNRQLDGLKFRRQTPVGKYIADFVCHEMKLVVELDGPSHDERKDHDTLRTAFLESQGFRVIRFLNEDVHRSIDDVLRAILRECGRPTE
jgi:very-short-patch-repair endonuclease